MSFDTTWDIDKYRSEHESEEHWNFRRQFIMKYKDRFAEDRLVCLAQIFFNVEFLGCRYPQKVMDLIEELSKDVADDLREKRKGKLQRTFVSISDVARAKRNRQSSTASTSNIEISRENLLMSSKMTPYDNDYILSGFMFLDANSNSAFEIIHRSCNFCNLNNPKIVIDESDPKNIQAKMYIKTVFIASGSGPTIRTARKDVSQKAYDKLKDICYTIKVKNDDLEKQVKKTDVITDELMLISNPLLLSSNEEIKDTKEKNNDNYKIHLPENNVGSKLLKMMGWKEGGGLGKNEQGRLDPIQVVQLPKHLGLGNRQVNNPNEAIDPALMIALRKEIEKHIMEFQNSPKKRLTFSTEFTKEERKLIHKICIQFGCKTKSYGRDDNRYMVISKKLSAREIFEELSACGNEDEYYILLPPKHFKADC